MPFPAHVPPAPLRPFVAAAHGYRVPANPTGLHRGLPSRHLTLVVELTGPLRVGGLGGQLAAHGVVGGLHTRPALIDASGVQEGLQYALTPLGAPALLGMPAAELHGYAVDLVELLGPRVAQLIDELRLAATWQERFRLVDAVLLDRLRDATVSIPAEVAEAWRAIFASDGRVRVAELAAHVSWSRRHLLQRFRLVTGLTPKQASRIARFEATKQMLLSPERPPLADIAVRCGYADQPHFAREWRALAGCSVGTWLREELPFVQDGSEVGSADSLA